MANLGGTYSAEGGKTMDDRSALPAGEYVAAMVKSERRDTKNGRGAYINCEFEVQDGEMKGRRFWTMLNLWNENTTAVEMAERELNSIMHACGKLRVQDTEELHGIPILVKLKVKTDSYGEKNEAATYAPVAGVAHAAQFRPAAAASGGRTPPWGARTA